MVTTLETLCSNLDEVLYSHVYSTVCEGPGQAVCIVVKDSSLEQSVHPS